MTLRHLVRFIYFHYCFYTFSPVIGTFNYIFFKYVLVLDIMTIRRGRFIWANSLLCILSRCPNHKTPVYYPFWSSYRLLHGIVSMSSYFKLSPYIFFYPYFPCPTLLIKWKPHVQPVVPFWLLIKLCQCPISFLLSVQYNYDNFHLSWTLNPRYKLLHLFYSLSLSYFVTA